MVKSNRWTRATAPHGILVDLYWPNAPPVWPTLTPRTDPPGTPFPFLSLPRELRDQVYFHILPPTLEYHQPTAKATKWWECDSGWWPPAPRRPVPHLPLLLACRQLHDEAQALLSLTTTISLPSYSRAKRYQNDERLPLHLLLCSFPSSLAGMVTRVSRSYPNYSRPWFGNFEINSAFDMWAYVVSESHILKEHLPRLRRFEAKWSEFEKQMVERWWYLVAALDPAFGESKRRASVEEAARVLVTWLEGCVQNKGLLPPVWLSIRFDHQEQVLEADKFRMKALEDALALAHRLLAEKRPTREETEETGRKWLMGLSAQRNRKRKEWCDAYGDD